MCVWKSCSSFVLCIDFPPSCPRRVFALDDKKGRVDVVEEAACIFCDECVINAEKLSKPDLVAISTKPNRFVFSVETTGSLNADQVVTFAINVLREKLLKLSSALSIMEL
jgi:DNA-directed RNA polymerase II subunit RPB3